MKQEYTNQTQFINMFRMFYPTLIQALQPSLVDRSQGIKKGVVNKALGYQKGTPDLFIAIATKKYHGLYLEFKSDSGKISKEQKECHSFLLSQGYQVATVRSSDEAFKIVREYMN